MLTEVSPGIFYLDHRIRPETRAMLCAMASRMPVGGIKARYQEIVEAAGGEEVLKTEIPQKVQHFFDKFVSQYGHCLHPMTQVLISPEIEKYEWVTILDAAERWRQGEAFRIATWDPYTRFISLNRPLGLVEKDYAGDLIDVGYLCTPDHTLYASVNGEPYSHISAETAYQTAQVLRQRSSYVLQHPGVYKYIDDGLMIDSMVVKDVELTKAHYEGKVYCFTTTSGFLAVRSSIGYITGNSSVMELVGSPSIFVEGVSPWTSLMSFDNPLVIGQELSTRALRRKNWPIARELSNNEKLLEHHKKFLEVFNKEVEIWKKRLKGTTDNDPFRPALDRARWALPTTIATGFAQTANPRVMGRVVNAGKRHSPAIWEEIGKAYSLAVPKIAESALRDRTEDSYTEISFGSPEEETKVVDIWLAGLNQVPETDATYLHPLLNRVRVSFQIYCSVAVMRDWHRHRTWLPFQVVIVDPLQAHPAYEAKEELFNEADSLRKTLGSFTDLHAVPMGAACVIKAQAGLRDFVYACQLRSKAHGANYEYKQQAEDLLASLRTQMPSWLKSNLRRHLC